LESVYEYPDKWIFIKMKHPNAIPKLIPIKEALDGDPKRDKSIDRKRAPV